MTLKKSTMIKKMDKGYELEYDILCMMIGTGALTTRNEFNTRIGREYSWLTQYFKPWMRENKPEMYNNIDSIMERNKLMKRAESKIPDMADILTKQVNIDDMVLLFKDQIQHMMREQAGNKIKTLLNSMENDLLATRSVALQACMLAITGYFQSIAKRVQAGKEIYTKEFKYAYEIYKTEMWEPIKIKETRTKNLQVTLQVPVSKEDIMSIIATQKNQDMEINVAEAFKEKLDDKFNLNVRQHDQHVKDSESWEHWAGDRADGTTPKTEEIPGERTIQWPS